MGTEADRSPSNSGIIIECMWCVIHKYKNGHFPNDNILFFQAIFSKKRLFA